jgi:hypothetical protein
VHSRLPHLPQGTALAGAARRRDAARVIVLEGCGEPDFEMGY